MKALRIYYNENGDIIWTSGLEGPGEFPLSVDDELKQLPVGTQCLEIADAATIDSFSNHEGNKVIDGKLVLGVPIIVTPPVDWQAHFDSAQNNDERIRVLARMAGLKA